MSHNPHFHPTSHPSGPSQQSGRSNHPGHQASVAFGGAHQHGLAMLNAPLHGSDEWHVRWEEYDELVTRFVHLLGDSDNARLWGKSIRETSLQQHWHYIEESTRHAMYNRLERAYLELYRHGNPAQYRRPDFVLSGAIPPFEDLTFDLDLVLEGEADANTLLPRESWFNLAIAHQVLSETVPDALKVLTTLKDDICVAAAEAEEECEHLYDGLVGHWQIWTPTQQAFVQNLFINILSRIKTADSYHEIHPQSYRVFIPPLPLVLERLRSLRAQHPIFHLPLHQPLQSGFPQHPSQHGAFSLSHSSRNISGRKKQIYGARE